MPAKSHWLERCKRLAGMDWEELGERTRQEAAKHSDFILGSMGVRFMRNGCAPWSQGYGRFFFWPEQVPEIVDWLRAQRPEIVDETVNRAEQICRHRFDLLGYEAVDYGAEIDWHLDAVHGKQAPRIAWFRVRYLDFHQVGDAKVIWELNRHQHLVTLAKAYRLTAEARYAKELFRQWYGWQEQNPYGVGINWASSLEVAFRSLSWLWIWHLLHGCAEVPERFPGDLWQALRLNARHIERFLSTYFSPNTHLIGEGVGLFFIGTLCPGSASAQRWQDRGWQILLRESSRQVRPDGMHFEQSLYYHVYALDFFLHARILAELNQIPIPGTFNRTIENMLNVLCNLHKAGPIPGLGDDDGGRVFDARRNRVQHLLDPLATGAMLFDRADFKTSADNISEEAIWLLGIDAANRFEKLHVQQDAVTSFALKPSGIYVLSSSKPMPQQLMINAGPQTPGRLGHSHADALSVQLSVNRLPVLIDPGTFAYADSGKERDRFRGTASHNTVQVDGVNQAEPAGPFGWHNASNASIERWFSSNSFDFFSGSHDDYNRLKYAVRHRRSIFFLKPHFWFIRDVVEGDGVHQLDLSWHFAPGKLSRISGGVAFTGNNTATLAILSAASRDCSQEISQGWYSPVYGKKKTAPILRLGMRTALPAEFATMLIPISQPNAHVGLLQPFETEHKGMQVRAYQYSIAGSTDYLFFADEAGSWQFGPWASDARFLFCSTISGNLNRFIVCDGSFLEVGGRRVFSAKTAMVRDERIFDMAVSNLERNVVPQKLALLNMGTSRNGSYRPASRIKVM